MLIAEQHLGLLGGAPVGLVGSWRAEGDLPWALASQLAPLALQSGALSAEHAGRVALGACGAVERALRPVLQQDDSSSEPSTHGSPLHASLPTPAFVAAAAALAAQTADSLSETPRGRAGAGGEAAERVTDTLLTVCEDCTAAVAELGVGDRASDALLNISIAIARQLLPLLAGAGERDPSALQDLLPRLQAVLVRTWGTPLLSGELVGVHAAAAALGRGTCPALAARLPCPACAGRRGPPGRTRVLFRRQRPRRALRHPGPGRWV